jgi:hypothetical protein
MTFDHGPINELIGGPHRRHRGHLVDNDLGRRRIAQHGQQYDRRIVAATPVDGGFSTLGNEVRITSAAGLSGLANSNRPSLLVHVWASWLGSPALAPQRVTVEFASGPLPLGLVPRYERRPGCVRSQARQVSAE